MNNPPGVLAPNTLLFCPENSMIRKTWLTGAFPWMSQAPVLDKYWSLNFATFRGHQDPIEEIAISPDGIILASGSDDSTIRIWNTLTGRTQETLKLVSRRSLIRGVVISSNGILAAGLDDDVIMMWDLATGLRFGQTLDVKKRLRDICFSLDGKQLAVSSRDGIHIWHISEGTQEDWKPRDIPVRDIQDISYTTDGKHIIAYTYTRTRLQV